MRIFNTLLASLAVILSCGIAVSCSSDDDGQGEVVIKPGDFEVSKSAIALAGTQEETLSIKSPIKPTVVSDAEWLRVCPVELVSAPDRYSCTVGCEKNPTYDVRTATLTVKAAAETRTVTVTQYGSETVKLVSVTPGTELSPDGGSLTVTYSATGDVTVKCPEWMSLSTPRSLDEGSYAFSYSANNTSEGRGGDIVIALASDDAISAVVPVTQAVSERPEGMRSSAMQLAAKMFTGVNIGNTLEPPSGEGTWGTPKITPEYIKGLKALGFNAVRLPCAWDSHVVDASANKIDPAWLDRVNEVVGYIVREDMYVIVNIHWDGGWLEESCSKGYSEAVDKKQHDYWTQIATRLNHYDEHLFFAAMNEPGMQNGLENAAVAAIKRYQQTFVDAVRATGGNNAVRCLVVQSPKTSIDEAVKFTLPTDVVSNRMLVEVHMYDPSDYTIMEKDGDWFNGSVVKLYWGSKYHKKGSNRNCTASYEEAYMDTQFKKMQNAFVDKGIPVIVGEYSSAIRDKGKFPDLDEDLWRRGRAYWNEYVTMSAKNHGCVPFYWETGGDIDRVSGRAKNAYAIDGIMKGARSGKYPF